MEAKAIILLECWNEVSTSPYNTVGSHTLVGFIFTSGVVVEVKTELFWRNDSYSASYPQHFTKRHFPRGPSHTSNLQAVVLQYLLKYEKLSPSVFRLALPPGWLAEPHSISAAPVFDLAHGELQSLGLGLKTTPSTHIQVYWRPLPRTWEAFFFKETNTFHFQLAWGKAKFLFFSPYLFFFSAEK